MRNSSIIIMFIFAPVLYIEITFEIFIASVNIPVENKGLHIYVKGCTTKWISKDIKSIYVYIIFQLFSFYSEIWFSDVPST